MIKGPGWVDYTTIQVTILREKPQGVTVVHDDGRDRSPWGVLDTYKPDLVWAFSDTIKDRAEAIMDLAASRGIPSTHYWHGGKRRYGW